MNISFIQYFLSSKCPGVQECLPLSGKKGCKNKHNTEKPSKLLCLINNGHINHFNLSLKEEGFGYKQINLTVQAEKD